MNKCDKIGAILRKLDHEWSKNGKTFCGVIKEFTGSDIHFKNLTDDEVLINIKDIFPEEKHK